MKQLIKTSLSFFVALTFTASAYANRLSLAPETRILFDNYTVHKVLTADGIALTVIELLGRDGKPMEDATPKMLVHGYTSNINSWYQTGPLERQKGKRVFIANWRGHGQGSTRSVGADGVLADTDPRMVYDNLPAYDVPALLDFAYKKSNGKKVEWVGHSMGGMMMHLALAGVSRAENGEMVLSKRQKNFIEHRLASFTAVGSPVRFDKSNALEKFYFGLMQLKGIKGDKSAHQPGLLDGLPLVDFYKGVVQEALYHSGKLSTSMDGLLNMKNISLDEFKKMSEYLGSNVPKGLVRTTAFNITDYGYGSADGNLDYEALSMKGPPGGTKVPVTIISAEKDLLASPESLAETARIRQLPFYMIKGSGHVDLVLGGSRIQLDKILNQQTVVEKCSRAML